MKLKIDDLVSVAWVDQNSFTEQHKAKGALSTALGLTVGHYLEESAEWLCIGMERMEMGDGHEAQYRHIVSFPKCCITEVARLVRGKRIKI